MNPEQQRRELKVSLDSMGNHQWTTLIRYFLPQLMEDQCFLFELLSDRASRMATHNKSDSFSELFGVCKAVGVQFSGESN